MLSRVFTKEMALEKIYIGTPDLGVTIIQFRLIDDMLHESPKDQTVLLPGLDKGLCRVRFQPGGDFILNG
jgi:hypothetical protein